MHGRVGALALAVGLAGLAWQATPASADSCMMVGGNGSALINEQGSNHRSWLIIVDGVTFESDQFDKFTKVQRKVKSTVENEKKKIKQVVFTFKDSKGIARTNGDGEKSVDVSIKGEVNEYLDSGFIAIKDRSDGREYRIDDPETGPQINCG